MCRKMCWSSMHVSTGVAQEDAGLVRTVWNDTVECRVSLAPLDHTPIASLRSHFLVTVSFQCRLSGPKSTLIENTNPPGARA